MPPVNSTRTVCGEVDRLAPGWGGRGLGGGLSNHSDLPLANGPAVTASTFASYDFM